MGTRRVFASEWVNVDLVPDAAEASRVEWVPLADLRALIASGQIGDGPSLRALSTFLLLR